MRILHMISGGDVGGAKTHVLSLLQGLGQTEEVCLICFTDGAFADEARALGIHTEIMAGQNLLAVRTRLIKRIREGKFDLIHCHGSRANLMGALVRGAVKIPVLTTVHSDPKLDYLGRPLGKLTYGNLNAWALRHVDYYVGVSNSMVDLLIRRNFPPQKMFPIYNGVSFPAPVPELSREEFFRSIGLSCAPDAPVFGIAARLNPVKDMTTLIRSFAKTVAKYPDARLIIAGDGEQYNELTALANQLCPEGSVLFAGWVQDTASFYAALDCNLLTSLSETFPYALTEGARLRCATIASRVGGIPDLIDHGINGFLFPAQDVDALADAMCALAADPALRRQFADRLYEKVLSQFSVEATVNTQKTIYETVLRRAERNYKRDGVMICGAYGKDNAGDDAILETIVAQMHDIDPDLPLCVLSRTPEKTRLRYRIDAVQTFHVLSFLRKMRKTALYLSGGGSLIQDVTSSRSLLYYLFNIYCAKATGNRVLMYGCGIGPVNKPRNRRLAAKVINRYVDKITLREDSSLQELQEMGVTRPEIQLTADPALLLNSAADHEVDSFFHSADLDPREAYCAFSLRPWHGFDDSVKAFAACAEHAYKAHGLIPLFLNLEPERDTPAAQKVAALLHCPYKIVPVPPNGTLTVGMIRRCKAMVSIRLHALIFATAQNIPTVGVVYDPKVNAYLDYLGESHYANLDGLQPESLCNLLDDALQTSSRPDTKKLRQLAQLNADTARFLLEESK